MKHKCNIQGKKLNNRLKDKKPKHDLEKFLIILAVLSEVESSLFLSGLNVRIPPKNLNHANYLVHFELLYSDNRALSAEDLDFIRNNNCLLFAFTKKTWLNIHQKENLML